MITIEKYKILAWLENSFHQNKDGAFNYVGGVDCSIKDIVNTFNDYLSQSQSNISLSDVDKAAEEYADKHPTCGLAKYSFKAGVEWMAAQGVSYEDRIVPTSFGHIEYCIDGYNEIETITDAVKNNILSGCDEVIVQIRKK